MIAQKNGKNPRFSFAGNLFESQMCRLSIRVTSLEQLSLAEFSDE